MIRIGIDGGGTTTRAAIIKQTESDIQVLGRGEAGSSNHYNVGLDATAANIQSAIEIALQEAKIESAAISSYGFGLAGVCTPAEQNLLSDTLAPITQGKTFAVDEDAAAAQSGSFAGGAGAVCIAGTGANCFGINEQGERARADGLGPLLGDRGGGYRIGEAALRAICSTNDGSGPHTSLLEPCLRALNVANIDELVQIVYQPEFSRTQIAALFPIVLQEAQNDDQIARGMLHDAGRDLACTTLAVLKKLNLQRVAVVGGVLTNAALVRASYEAHLQEAIPEIEVILPQYDAAIGAALLARA